jgi:hypothetical protein
LIAAEAHGWDPSEFHPHSNKKLDWRCKNGHIWKSTVTNRTRRNDGCAICSNHKTLAGFNDLLTTDPELSKEAYAWNPNEVTRSSNKKKKWQCPIGHVYTASVNSRTTGSGCPICAGKQVLVGYNDLATVNPKLANEAFDWNPVDITFGSSKKKLKWKCSRNHVFSSTVANRSNGKNCPYCTNQKVLVGFNDLATTNPDLIESVNGWDPRRYVAGSTKRVSWKCSLGHEYTSTIVNRLKAKSCPYCSNKKVLKGFNDLRTSHPEIANTACDWDPETVTAGSEKRMAWQCEKGHIWKAPVYHRTGSSKTGCPTCSKSGFDPNSAGYLYFIQHREWEMLQIGITNNPDDRLKRHKRIGWELLGIRGPMDGYTTQELETELLRMLRSKGAKLSPKEVAGKFDGYSEAWLQSTYPIQSIQELMEDLREYELGVSNRKNRSNDGKLKK